jgi:hypothetical protein
MSENNNDPHVYVCFRLADIAPFRSALQSETLTGELREAITRLVDSYDVPEDDDDYEEDDEEGGPT